MQRFAFKKLRVYEVAMQSALEVSRIARGLPRTEMDLVWQIRRAARSVVLNIAEGAGEYAPQEKARIYRIARRSAWETVAALDIVVREGLAAEDEVDDVLSRLDYVIGMLTTMGKRAEDRAKKSSARSQNKKRELNNDVRGTEPRPRPRPRPERPGEGQPPARS